MPIPTSDARDGNAVWLTPAAFRVRMGGVRRMAIELERCLIELGVVPGSPPRSRHREDDAASAVRLAAASARDSIAIARHRGPAPAVHSIYYDAPMISVDRLVVTVHDMIHERFAVGSALLRAAKRRSVRRASVVACLSQRTMHDLVQFGLRPSRTLTIPLGVSEPIWRGDDVADPADGHPYLLYIGERGSYKNFGLLLEAMARERRFDDVGLVLVGGETVDEDGLDTLRDRRGGAGTVRRLVGVDDVALGALYRGAAAVVVTSRYEGFGLPLLEAMACGCPVASTGGGALSEHDGGHAFRFQPSSPTDCAAAVLAAMESDRGDPGSIAHARSFTWQETARSYAELYAP